MAESWKCPACGSWIGAMQVHQDCARKQDEKRRRSEPAPECTCGWHGVGARAHDPNCPRHGRENKI